MAKTPTTPPRSAVLPLTGTLPERVRECARLGLPDALIGQALGYDPDLWAGVLEDGRVAIQQGRPEDAGIAAELVANIRIGAAEHQAGLIQTIALTGGWKGATWLLEHVHGYASRTRVDAETVLRLDPMTVEGLSREALEALAEGAPKARAT